MKTEILNKNNFNYIDKGKGKPIVLLHGLMGSLSNFKNCIEDLPKQGFRVIMPMLPIYDLPLLKTSAKELSNFLNRLCFGKRIARFFCLLVTNFEIFEFFFNLRINVIGPGENLL